MLLFIIVIAAVSITAFITLKQSAYRAIEHGAYQSAQIMAASVKAARNHYSANVTQRLSSQPQIYIGAEYKNREAAIPNPATFTIEMATLISKKQGNLEVRMYSDYPFPNRISSGGAKSAFEKQSLQQFRREKTTEKDIHPSHQVSYINSEMVFEYIEPIVMEATCVDCHNTLEESPKKDWKLGDIRGALSITQSMANNHALQQMETISILMVVSISVFSALLLAFNFKYSRKKILSNTQDILKIANTDPLTELRNRRGFEQSLEHYWNDHKVNRKYLSIIFCDLDKFKQLNDLHGHAAGDQHLIDIATIIKSTLRHDGDFAARIGGDEFIFVLANTNPIGGEEFAKRFLARCELYDGPHPIKCSLGIASAIPGKGITSAELLHQADSAMYLAKSSSTECYQCWSPRDA